MKFTILALSCIACAPSKTLATYVRTNKLSSRSLSGVDETCTAVMVDTQFEHNGDVFEAPIDHHSIECFTSDGTVHSVPSADEDFIHKNFIEGDFISGETNIIFESKMQKNGTSKPVFSSPPVLIKKTTRVEGTSGNGRKLDITGDLTVLAIRVVLSDGATTANENAVRDGIFGDNVNLRSQYSDCSHDQLNFDSVGTINGNSLTINDGVITINLPNSQKSDGNTAIRNAINSAISADFGESPAQIADHVMYCLPSGTFGGIAFAGVNSWYSVYSNEWCGYSAVQMHEIGHNIGLAHAGDGTNQYGDQSGNMGYSYSEANTLMCFNAAKSWQLGWYSDSAVTIDAVANRSYEGEVASIIEDPFTVQVPIIIKLNTPVGDDYFLNFNRRTDFNSGTKEGSNQVMITKAGSEGNSYSQSWLQAKLSANGSWESPANFNGETVTVTVISIGTTRASVKICVGTCPGSPIIAPVTTPVTAPVTAPTSPPNPSPAGSPTLSPVGSPTSSPVGSPTSSPVGSPTSLPRDMIPFTYSYPKGDPPGCCGGYYDDPNLNILNSDDGSNPESWITRTNSIEWDTSKHDYEPLLDLNEPHLVNSVKVSYIVNTGWGKTAPKTILIEGSLNNDDTGCMEYTANVSIGFSTSNGGHTVTVSTEAWGPVQYIKLTDVIPSGKLSVVSNIAVYGNSTSLPPVGSPTPSPVGSPTSSPVNNPTPYPSKAPTLSPVGSPTLSPIGAPDIFPTSSPNSISCSDTCYENPATFFLLKVKNKVPTYETCEELAKMSKKAKKKFCNKEKKSLDGYGPASVHCRVTCSEWLTKDLCL